MPVSNDTPKSDTCVLKAKNMQLVKSNSLSETPFSTTPLMQQNDNLDELSGSLLKWTDYLKGYQKRWFILNNGTLYYYSIKNKTAYACRGSINLLNSIVKHEYFSTNFTICNQDETKKLYLKAKNQYEKQKWLAAIEFCKNKLIQEDYNISLKNSSYQKLLKDLNSKLNDIVQFYNLIEINSNELEKLLQHINKLNVNDINNNHVCTSCKQSTLDESIFYEKLKSFKISLNLLLSLINGFIELARKLNDEKDGVLEIEFKRKKELDETIKKVSIIQTNIQNELRKTQSFRLNDSSDNKFQFKKPKKSLSLSPSPVIKSLSPPNSIITSQNTKNQTKTEKFKEKLKISTNSKKKLKMLDKVKTESQLSALLSHAHDESEEDFDKIDNKINNQLKFKQTSSIDLKNSQRYTIENEENVTNLRHLIDIHEDAHDDEDETINNEKFYDAVQDTTTFNLNEFDTSSANNEPISNQTTITQDSIDLIENMTRNTKNLVPKVRRKEIPQRPSSNINCIDFIKSCIGKSLDEIPIPFNHREPLSMLQRITEEIEYTYLLDKAAKCTNQWEQMTYVAAFSISCYCTTQRTYKPFNALLGETYEYDCTNDLPESNNSTGWRSIAEQVSINPPITALNVQSVTNDWELYHEFKMTSKFRVQYLQVIPECTTHLIFKKSGNHYTWPKVNTYVHNILLGKIWIENVGDIDIINHKTKDLCHLKYSAYNFFSSKQMNKVSGLVTDANHTAHYVINGTWNEQIEAAQVLEPKVVTKQILLKTGTPNVLWKRNPVSSHVKNMYNFTDFTIKLNEPDTTVAPTDSRNRPDESLMEKGLWDEANKENIRLEDKQRHVHKTNKLNENESIWFKKAFDPYTNQQIYMFKNEYWSCKSRQHWKHCPDLY